MSTSNFEINHTEVTTPPRPSSTVLLLRDSANDSGGSGGNGGNGGGGGSSSSSSTIEVLMQRRHEKNDVLAGAYVFPGGKVDRADGEIDMLSRLDVSAAQLHARMGDSGLDERGAAVYFAAACREIFEEAGLLLATRADGTPADGALADEAMRWLREGLSFAELLERFDLTMSASSLVLWSRWVTPRVPSLTTKRFDVRFFLARMPAGQTAIHDNHEAVDSLWIAPRIALERFRSGEMKLAPPQIMSMVELARHATVDAAMHADAIHWPRLIEPMPFEHEGTRAVAYPGDPLHTNPQRVMPGPTRLIFRDGRFVPFGDFEELFA